MRLREASVRSVTIALRWLDVFRNRHVWRSQGTGWLERNASAIDDPYEKLRFLRTRQSELERIRRRVPRPALVLASMSLGLLAVVPFPTISDARPAAVRPHIVFQARMPASGPVPQVWSIEKLADHETFSNGLRVENRYVVEGKPRGEYAAFPAVDPMPANAIRFDRPAGIVFHTTESDEVPFDPSESETLQRVSANLLAYVRQKAAYHFVIDRFGRAFRVVPEEDMANHAGDSAWADDRYLYLDLNRSFIGVAFETRTQAGDANAGLTAAQIVTAKELTDMLRSRYGISAADCVTHAQISLNPGQELLGWHTDFAASFPFAAAGLPDNYALPPAALYLLGFHYDDWYVRATGTRVEKGLAFADDLMREQAAKAGVPVNRYRRTLMRRYRELVARERADGMN